jgi:hypothetical protein
MKVSYTLKGHTASSVGPSPYVLEATIWFPLFQNVWYRQKFDIKLITLLAIPLEKMDEAKKGGPLARPSKPI